MQKKIIFLCEASSEIGAGHVIRCVALAEEMQKRGWQPFFVAKKETYGFIPTLQKFQFVNLQEYLTTPFYCDLVVLDRYDQVAVRENPLFKYAKKIMVLDDHANRSHECDFLVDSVLGRKEGDYIELVPSSCRILVGPRYSILRKAIREGVAICLAKRERTSNIRHILINFGGGEQKKCVLNALGAIKKTLFMGDISIVFGFAKVGDELITELQNSNASQKLNIYNSTDMVERIYEADLSIGSPGGAFFERCALGLPSILYDIVPHQKVMSSVLRKLNCPGATVIDDLSDSLKKTLKDLLSFKYSDLFHSVIDLCDAKGVEYVANNIEEILI